MSIDLALLSRQLPRVTAAGTTAAATVDQLARPVDVVDADLAVRHLERAFGSRHLTCVAVRAADSDRLGLVTRRRFVTAMSGSLGYGHALLARGTTSDIADWTPLVVEPDSSILDVALAAMDRNEDRRYDEILVRAATWRVTTASDLVRSLSTLVAVRTLHDPLTTLANRSFLLHQLRERCARSRTTPARVAVVRLDIAGFGALNAEYGHAAGDAFLEGTAMALRRAMPTGCDAGRTGEDEFTVIATVPGPCDDAGASAAVERLRSSLGEALEAPMTRPGIAGSTLRARVRTAAVCSAPGGGDPEHLLAVVHAHLRERERHRAGSLQPVEVLQDQALAQRPG